MLAEFNGINIGGMNVLTKDSNLTFGQTSGIHEIIHAIKTTEEGRLPATRWPDERSHFPLGNVKGDVAQGVGADGAHGETEYCNVKLDKEEEEKGGVGKGTLSVFCWRQ